MRFSLRGFRGFDDWVDFEDGPATLVAGPNASGKSGLIEAFLLLREQRDMFRLSFSGAGQGAGAGRGTNSFAEAVSGRDRSRSIDFLIRCSVDAARVMCPAGQPPPDPVPYDFELYLSYASDGFDGGASGILQDASVCLVDGEGRVPLFSAQRSGGAYELYLGAAWLLGLPFVQERAVGSDEGSDNALCDIDRAVRRTAALARSASGRGREAAERLLESFAAARRVLAMNRELSRIVLPPGEGGAALPYRPRAAERACRVEAAERKYLRSIADILVAESLGESGIRSMRSRESGREIRLSFHSLFYEILAAAGFAGPRVPLALYPARERPAGPGSAIYANELVRRAEGEYGATLRDAVNLAAARRGDGASSPEGPGFAAGYGETIIAFREAHPGESLVPEGGELDPDVLDLEARRRELQSALAALGIGEDLEFPLAASEDRAILVDAFGRRETVGSLGEGPRRLVVLASSLLYLPWGGLVVVEDAEAGLDAKAQEGLADLAARLARRCGARCLVETRSPSMVRAFAARAKGFEHDAGGGEPQAGLVVLACANEGGRRSVRAMRPDAKGRFGDEEERTLFGTEG